MFPWQKVSLIWQKKVSLNTNKIWPWFHVLTQLSQTLLYFQLPKQKKILFLATRSLIYGQNNMQTWGLIVLLVSKMAGHADGILESEQDKSAGVLMSQRTLAEVVEMVRTANMIHSSGVLNLQHLQKSGNDLSFDSDLIFGNKIACMCHLMTIERLIIMMLMQFPLSFMYFCAHSTWRWYFTWQCLDTNGTTEVSWLINQKVLKI